MAERCEVCNIDLADDYALQGHLSGKKHANNLRFSQLRKGIEERSIFVSDWPPFVSHHYLIEFLLQFGQIESHKFERDYALIQFTTKTPVEFLTTNPISIRDHRLRIKRRIFHQNTKPIATETESKLCYKDFKHIFEGETTFDSQLIAFLNEIQHNDVVVEEKTGSVCASLESIFRTEFRNCKVHRFGSTVTGLNFKKSDLDIYVDIGLPIHENGDEANPKEWTPKKVFRGAKSLLYKRKNIFTNIVLVPNAKTPIIKFRHIPTNISCDISFKNSLGVCNSKMIKHYLALDVRLKPLMIILKFWGQLYEISGTGKISNYALIMLIIFYLQQPEKALVPTVAELKSTCVPQLVQGWQVNYDDNMKFNQIKNDINIPDLLCGFFDFYANFEFGSKVVCPLDGKAHLKTAFNNAKDLPASMSSYKEYLYNTSNPSPLIPDKPMCIQDPIELNHNVTAGISSRMVEFFHQHCITSRDVCREAQANGYKNLFSLLFTIKIKFEKQMKFKLAIQGAPFLKSGLPANTVLQPGVIYRDHFTIDNWYDAVLNITKETFERVLKLEVRTVSYDREAKQQKCETQSDVHSKDNTKIVFECSGFLKLWYGRKNKEPVLDPTLSLLDREAHISNSMIQEMGTTPTSSVPIINFTCVFEKQTKDVSVALMIKNNNSPKKVFHGFSGFVTGKLRRIIDKTLIHMLQYKKLAQQSSSESSS